MDRRQRRTRKAIFDAFEELMSESHYSQLTVAQIIDRADVGRSTFYAHFETKDELADQAFGPQAQFHAAGPIRFTSHASV